MGTQKKIKIALIQMASSSNKTKNLQVAVRFCLDAIRNGAKFVLFPEMFNCRNDDDFLKEAEFLPGVSIEPFMGISRQFKVWILAGSLYERVLKEKKVYNSSVIINDAGKIKAIYRKIHLFDVKLNTKIVCESKMYFCGREPIIVSIAGIKTGLAICYDLRFPELFRYYSKEGVKMICIPSSFTAITGRAHWEVLLRARAIENQSFVLAPNQCGMWGRIKLYGNSMVVSPWGNVLARASENKQEISYAILNFNHIESIRKNIPALKHRMLDK